MKIDGKMLGKLEVSKGSLVWYPKDTTYGHKISWVAFDTEMKRLPRGPEKRKKP